MAGGSVWDQRFLHQFVNNQAHPPSQWRKSFFAPPLSGSKPGFLFSTSFRVVPRRFVCDSRHHTWYDDILDSASSLPPKESTFLEHQPGAATSQCTRPLRGTARWNPRAVFLQDSMGPLTRGISPTKTRMPRDRRCLARRAPGGRRACSAA